MITKHTIYVLTCDKCGIHLTHNDNKDSIEFWDKLEADWQAEQQNWTIKDDEHYCPACQEELEQERTYE